MSCDLLLIDGSAYLFRAYHAMPPLNNSQGQETGAIFGVVNMLKSLLQKYNAKYVAVVFDAKGPTFRHDLYPQYKQNRSKMPDELASQIKPLHAIIKAMGLPLLVIDGVEADDVIGTLARHATTLQLQTLIVTNDKDMAQLVDNDVKLFNATSNVIIDSAGVQDKFGVLPRQIVDYLALVGDAVDNIPGVYKVGAKTAVKWLQEYDTLENLLANADKINGKVGESLRSSFADIPLYKQLTTIKCDVDLPVKVNELIVQEQQTQVLQDLYAQLNFRQWLAATPETSNKQEYQVINSAELLNIWYASAKLVNKIAFYPVEEDLETIYMGFVCDSYIGLIVIDKVQIKEQQLAEILVELFAKEFVVKVVYDLKKILKFMSRYKQQIYVRNCFDVLLASYVYNSTATKHQIVELVTKYLGKSPITLESITGKGRQKISLDILDLKKLSSYVIGTTELILQLYDFFKPKLEAMPPQQSLFELEMQLAQVLAAMETQGVLISVNALHVQNEQILQDLQQLERQAYLLAQEEFNLLSPKQLQYILFDKLNLPITEKTPTGQPSTSESALQPLIKKYPLVDLVLQYKSLSKLKSSYTDKLPSLVNPTTGRIHTSYHQAVTSTGRLSSSAPNLQNIPIRSVVGKQIRQAFIAPPGYVLLSADYSQIELRIMAHLSKDVALLDIFKQQGDVHQRTASEIFNVALTEVTDGQRRFAKAINFGLMYGMSSFGLAKQLDISREQADVYINAYFARFPRVADFIIETRDFAKTHGFVETLLGRRLYLPDIHSKNVMQRKAAARAAINAPMQGGQADIIKKAMIALHEWCCAQKFAVHMVMQVHDELIFEVPLANLKFCTEAIRNIMQDIVKLNTPLIVDIGVGDHWALAH